MTIRPMALELVDVVECGELLEFLGGWLAGDGECLAESLDRFVGGPGYGINELRADLSRFAALLGGAAGGDLEVRG